MTALREDVVAGNGTAGPALEFDRVSVTVDGAAGSVELLREIDLSVAAGSTLGLVGESGSGKSITCMTAAGLLHYFGGRISHGRVLVNGVDMTTATDSQWRKMRGTEIGYVFQQPIRSLNPAFTVGEQVAEVLRVKRGMGRRAAWNEAVSLLDRVRIADAAQRASDYPHMMSGGMAQRAAIAIAIACRPRLLIADEPTTALDATVAAKVLQLLRELQLELGLAIVYVSHDLGVIRDISDRVAVMYAGEIIEEGAGGYAFLNASHPYTKGLLGATPTVVAKGRLDFIPGTVPHPSKYPDSCRFADRCSWLTSACTEERILMHTTGEGHARCVHLDVVNNESEGDRRER